MSKVKIVLLSTIFILFFITIFVFWMQTTAKQINNLKNSEQESGVLDGLKRDLSEIGEQIQEARKEYKARKKYLEQKQEKTTTTPTTKTTSTIPLDLIEKMKSKIESSSSTPE